MFSRPSRWPILALAILALTAHLSPADEPQRSPTRRRIQAALDAVPAIDTHDHLPPRDQLRELVATPRGRGVNLRSIWQYSYFPGVHQVAPWPADGDFAAWWKQQQPNFNNAKATSSYRYLLPAFIDLYGVDFETITPEQASKLNDQIFANYQSDKWIEEVVTKRANIELMVVDPYWARLQFARAYRFTAPLLNVTTLMQASHPSQLSSELDSPYAFAHKRGLKTDTFEEFLAVVDAIFAEAVAADCVCLKSTQAYQRSLRYERVTKEKAAAAYGKAKKVISPQEQQDFEDFMFWHVSSLSAKYDLPFQIHTGHGRIQGSNPLLLVDLIAANPQTKYILFHGGYPWVGETAAIAMRHRNVWIDSVWLPTLSQTMARRAYQEWLDAVPSDRIMWGADASNVEGIYGATVLTRQTLAAALTEKVERGELREDDALRIGRQILRDNALAMFPKLRRWLWRKEEAAEKSANTRLPALAPSPRVPLAPPVPSAASLDDSSRTVSRKSGHRTSSDTLTALAKPVAHEKNKGDSAPVVKGVVSVRGRVVDADSGAPLPARLYIEGPAKGEWHTVRAVGPHGPGVEYRKNYGTRSVEIHTALPAADFTAELPPGTYTLTAERGKEWLPATAEIDIEKEPLSVELKLKRFVDVNRLGWFCGETHVHRALAELPTAMLADDLNVTLPITSWTIESDTVPPPPKEAAAVEPRLVEIDPTHVYWPLNTEYEIFNVKGKPHMLGAVFAINQQRLLKSTVPPVAPLAAEVHGQGALLEMDKHNWPWSMMIVPAMNVDLYELTNNHVWRTNFHFQRWAVEPPDYMKAERDANGLTENGWIHFTLQNYYCLLNCGYRLRPTAGTASGVHPVPLGYGRVYVHCPDGFSYEAWIKGLNAGRSFVTTGPLMDVRLAKQLPGHTFQQREAEGTYQLDGWLFSATPLSRVEVIVNGEVAAQLLPPTQPRSLSGGGFAARVSVPIVIRGSAWVALRCYEPTEAARSRFAHSAPWHIDVPDKPLRPRRDEVDFLVGRMEAEIKRHQGVLPEAAMAEYRTALTTYQKIAEVARPVDVNGKPQAAMTGVEWGDLRGVFRFAGEPPKPEFIKVNQDAVAFREPIPRETLVVDLKTHGIANIVVWLERPDGGLLPVHPAFEETSGAVVRQEFAKGRFAPHVALLRTSQTLQTVNSDSVAHAWKNNARENQLYQFVYPPMKSYDLRLQKSERLPFGISCPIHPWEKGYILVKDHPYMAVTNADGAFDVKRLPAGKWKFYFWQEQVGYVPLPSQGANLKRPYSPVEITIRPGENDFGTMDLKQELFERK